MSPFNNMLEKATVSVEKSLNATCLVAFLKCYSWPWLNSTLTAILGRLVVQGNISYNLLNPVAWPKLYTRTILLLTFVNYIVIHGL